MYFSLFLSPKNEKKKRTADNLYLENGHTLMKLVLMDYHACCDIYKETTIPIIGEIFSFVLIVIEWCLIHYNWVVDSYGMLRVFRCSHTTWIFRRDLGLPKVVNVLESTSKIKIKIERKKEKPRNH